MRRAGVTTQEDESAEAGLFKSLLTTHPNVTEAGAVKDSKHT
jgi:hypothetical protein